MKDIVSVGFDCIHSQKFHLEILFRTSCSSEVFVNCSQMPPFLTFQTIFREK